MTKSPLRLREIHGHVTVTPTTLTAWHILSPQRWSFTTDAQREILVTSYATALARLSGRTVHMRVTNRPYPAKQWATALDADTPHPLPGWSEHLTAAQTALMSTVLSDKEVYLGVEIPRKRPLLSRMKGAAAGLDGARAEIETYRSDLKRIEEIIAGPGVGGRPATTGEVEWLIHRSIRLGMPNPTRLTQSDMFWQEYDVSTFTDGVSYSYSKFGPVVKIDADYNGTVHTRYAAVMSLGRMPAITVPQTDTDPFQQIPERLGFPVEQSVRGTVVGRAAVRKATHRKRLAIRDMQRQYRQHQLDEPLELGPKARQAQEIERDVNQGDDIIATRFHAVYRLAVSARTEEECLRRVRAVCDLYQTQQIDVQHPRNILDGGAQLPLLGEFTPGETMATTAYMRRANVRHAAAGLPHVTASIGDRRGPQIGYTTSASRRAFMLDVHYPMEVRDASGLIPVVGTLGSGKSVLLAKLAYEEARRGILTTVLDPSGPLANLTQMESLRDHSRHIDLVRGEDGVLNPYSVIGDPLRENYASDTEWMEAVTMAQQDRKGLALDVARMLLPAQVDAMWQTPLRLADAIRAVGGDRTSSLHAVVDALLAQSDEHATSLANFLRDMAEMPQSRLFFPNHVREQRAIDDTLLVLTMNGITLPSPGIPRTSWSTAEQVSVPLLSLASHFATQRVYGRPRNERKMAALDEAGMVAEWGSGRNLFNRLGRDSRKFNVAVLAASQSPRDILGLDVANFISTAIVGRIEDESHAAEALRLLRVQEGVGYEAAVASLSASTALVGRRGPREFIVRDVDGNVEKVRVDISHQPDLLAAVNTTPGQMVGVA